MIEELRVFGHDVLPFREVFSPASADQVVAAKARELGRALLTLDGDFSDIVAYSPADFPGIVALQVRNRPEAIPAIVQRLAAFLEGNPQISGSLLLVEPHRVRVRR